MSIASTVKSWFNTGIACGDNGESCYNGPAVGMGENGGLFCEDTAYGYQRNLDMETKNPFNVPSVHGCVMAYSNAVSQCKPLHHKEVDGDILTLKDSHVARVLRKPNLYQTWTQFISMAVTQMKFYGESFVYIQRDRSGQVSELHIMQKGQVAPYLNPDTSELFYSVGANPFLYEEIDYLVPSRDIMHLRQHCLTNPLKGESDITAAMMSIGVSVELTKNQLSFFNNSSKPSGILSTDLSLTKDQILELRAAFNAQSKKYGTGGLPILSSGLRYQQMGMSSVDSQLIESKKMSTEEICVAFQIPQAVLGYGDATYSNSETLINNWLALSLGSLLENIERSLDVAFNLPYNEHIDLDVAALLRTNFETKINGLSKGVQNSLYSPDEARYALGMGEKDGGSDLYLQRQNVPIAKIGDIMQIEIDNANKPEPIVEEVIVVEEPPKKEEAEKSVEEEKAMLDFYKKQVN